MSTVKTINLQHPSSTPVNIVLGSDGSVTGGLPSPNRNLLYNGAMQVSQRGTSTTGITGTGYNTADRWKLQIQSLGTWTQDIQNDAPTGSGLRRSFRVLCTTADAAPAGTDYACVIQHLEGQDLQRIAKGTASAQQLTLSFWVKSNVTGTYSVMLYDSDNARFTSFTYSISASATWERKTITFASDTSGAFDNDNGDSLQVYFNLGAGSTYTGGAAQTTWSGGTAFGSQWMPSQVNLAAATNNYWQVTGVQLEVGPVATPFEFKSYGQELRECQRYFCKTASQGTDPKQNNGDVSSLYVVGQVNGLLIATIWKFPVSMRAAPAVTTFCPTAANANWTPNPSAPAATVQHTNTELTVITAGPTNVVAGNGFYLSAQAAVEL